MTRRLSERIREHRPAPGGSTVIKSINSLFCAHPVDTSHSVQPSQAFRPICVVRGINLNSFVIEFSQLRKQWEFVYLTHFCVPRNSASKFWKLPWPTSHSPLKSPVHPNNNNTSLAVWSLSVFLLSVFIVFLWFHYVSIALFCDFDFNSLS